MRAQGITAPSSVLPSPGRLRGLVTVSRVEFMPGGLFFVFASAALACRTWSAMDRGLPLIAAGAAVWYLSHLIGSQVNCLADVDTDRERKARLAAAAQALGRGPIVGAIAAEAAVALTVACFLAASTGRAVLPLLWLAGFALAMAYSLEPPRFKRRGWLNPCCLVLVLYALPMAFGYLTLAPSASWPRLGIAAATGLQMLALILLNPAEDVVADRAAGIETPCTRHGLRLIAQIAAALFVLGMAGTFWSSTSIVGWDSPLRSGRLLLALAAQLAVCIDLLRLALTARVDLVDRITRRNAAHFALLGITFAVISGLTLR